MLDGLKAWWSGDPAALLRREVDRLAREGPVLVFAGTELPPRPQSDFSAPFALAAVARRHGLTVSESDLAIACGADAHPGPNMFVVCETALHLGFDAKAAKLTEGADPVSVLARCPTPFITLFPKADGVPYWIVVERVGRTVAIADFLQKQTIDRDEFVERWTGNLLFIIPTRKLRAPPTGLRVSAVYEVEKVLRATGECEKFLGQTGFMVQLWDMVETAAVRHGVAKGRLTVVASWTGGEGTRGRVRMVLPVDEALEARVVARLAE